MGKTKIAFAASKFEWLSAVARDGDLLPSAVRLAVIMVNEFVNGDEFCDSGTLIAWPSADRLAGELGMTRRGVQKATDSLVEHGHLDRQIGGGWKITNRYTLLFKRGKLRTPVHPLETETVNGCSDVLRTPVHPNLLSQPIERVSPSNAFKAFWNHFPSKVGKKAAEKRFKLAVKDGTDHRDIIAGAKRYAADRDGQEPRFTKYPSNWLSAGCWEDEPAPKGSSKEPWTVSDEIMAEYKRREAGQ